MADWSEEFNYGVKNKALAASILKMSLRDGHHVIQSRMPAYTAAAIGYIADQLANGGLKPKPVSVAAGVLGKHPPPHFVDAFQPGWLHEKDTIGR